MSRIQKSLASASGSEKIELRSELAELVAKQAQQGWKRIRTTCEKYPPRSRR